MTRTPPRQTAPLRLNDVPFIPYPVRVAPAPGRLDLSSGLTATWHGAADRDLSWLRADLEELVRAEVALRLLQLRPIAALLRGRHP